MSSQLPRHIAIIMDGNGRWAEKQGYDREAGHKAGADSVREAVTWCRERGIRYLTLYAFSKENWQRPEKEVSFLFDLFVDFVKKEVPELIRQGIRLTLLGERGDLPFAARQALDWGIKKCAGGREMTLSLALSYSGREEILSAVRSLIREGVAESEITEDVLRRHMYSPTLPDPDLVIRTSGEFRLSNFLLFQSAYAELYFTDVLWPDFNREELDRALESYRTRKRRFGKTDAQLEQD